MQKEVPGLLSIRWPGTVYKRNTREEVKHVELVTGEGSAKVVCPLSGLFSGGRSLERDLPGPNEGNWPSFSSNLRTLPSFGDPGGWLWLVGEDLVGSPAVLWSS